MTPRDHDTMGPAQGFFTVVTLAAAAGVLVAGAVGRAVVRRLLGKEHA